MNKQELKRYLITPDVGSQNYTLNRPPYKDTSWVIEAVNDKKASDAWRVFNFERGKIYDDKLFDTEDQACRYIYGKLRKHHEMFNKLALNN